MPNLTQMVMDRVEDLGPIEAGRMFGVTPQTIYNWKKGKSLPSAVAAQIVLDELESVKVVDTEAGMWEGRQLQVLLPAYRSIHPFTHFTLFANYVKFGPERIGILPETRTLIIEARNRLAHKFLKTGSEWCIMVDDDMILPFGQAEVFNTKFGAGLPTALAGINTFERLMSHRNLPVVGGLYFGRHAKGKAQCSDGFESELLNAKLHKLTETSPRQVRWVATGVLRIHRSVFEKMMAKAPEKFPEIIPNQPDGVYGFFTPTRVGQGEDVAFSLRCGEIGLPVYVDPGCVCLHVGETFFGPKNTSY